MTVKHIEAILAKNTIARQVKELSIGEEVTPTILDTFADALNKIEAYIGTGSQPSVEELFKDGTGTL